MEALLQDLSTGKATGSIGSAAQRQEVSSTGSSLSRMMPLLVN